MKNKMLLVSLVLSLLFVASSAMAALPQDAILLEGEDAVKMDRGVKIVEKEGASGGKCINAMPDAMAYYEFDIPSDGDWYVWVRMFCPDGDADSLYIGIDKATPVPEDSKARKRAARIYSAPGDSVNTGGKDSFNVWYWDAGMDTGATTYFKVKTAGKTSLYIIGREYGTLIDQIVLVKDKDFHVEKELKGAAATK